jgi:hypothetical protein
MSSKKSSASFILIKDVSSYFCSIKIPFIPAAMRETTSVSDTQNPRMPIGAGSKTDTTSPDVILPRITSPTSILAIAW